MTNEPVSSPPDQTTLGALVAQMSEQTSQLIRNELRLAQLELTDKGKKAGIGAGMFGGAGVFALFGLGCLVTAAVLALAGPVPDWAAAIVVGVILFAIAGVAAIVGKREVTQATPPLPQQAVTGVKQDVQTLKAGRTA